MSDEDVDRVAAAVEAIRDILDQYTIRVRLDDDTVESLDQTANDVVESIDRLTAAVTKLGNGLKVAAASSMGGMLAEMITKVASAVPMPDIFAGGTEVDPTEPPRFPPQSLCKCMHISGEHLGGDGPCLHGGSHAVADHNDAITTDCSCSKFSYMVAPKPTEGRCLGCFCAPAQVAAQGGSIGEDGFCEACRKMRDLFPKEESK